MSFIVNPISRRVGFVKFWSNIWALNNWINYSVVNTHDKILLLYLKWFIELFKWNQSRKYTKMVKNLYLNTKNKATFNMNIIWTWPEWKILRLTESIILLCYFYIQNNNNQIKPLIEEIEIKKMNKNIFLQKILFIYNKFFKSIFLLELSNYYSLRLFYFKLLKYIYIYSYWFFLLRWTFNISIIQYISYYKFLYNINKWFNFWKLQIKYFLSKFNEIPFWISFYIMPLEIVTAIWLLNFIKFKLLQKFPIKLIILNMFNKLFNIYKYLGYSVYIGLKICVSGRFTRTERKLFWWQTKGFLGQSTFKGWFEYACTTIVLTNSICGLKIWFRKNPNLPKLETIIFYKNFFY